MTSRGMTMSTFIPQCMWTQRFFCFHKASLTTPTKRDEEFLQHAGLGLKKIKFDNKNADHNCVINRRCFDVASWSDFTRYRKIGKNSLAGISKSRLFLALSKISKRSK